MRQNIYKIISIYSFFSFEENLILELRDNLFCIEKDNDLSGLLIIAKEGINGTICAEEKVIEKVLNSLKKFIGNSQLNLKISYSKTKIFKKLKIKIKNEIVTMGIPEINPSKDAGTYIDSYTWNKLIQDKNTIVIDTRNHYEVSIGSFEDSINPNTRNFREFPEWVDNNLEKHLCNRQCSCIFLYIVR